MPEEEILDLPTNREIQNGYINNQEFTFPQVRALTLSVGELRNRLKAKKTFIHF